MSQPAVALSIAATLITVTCILFWPKKGWAALLFRGLRTDQRERIEDALKHLYDCEYVGTAATIQSLAGALELSNSRIAELIERLEAMQLVRSQDVGLHLTAEGRRYALRIIRIHRLWETYLADQTGLEEGEWHGEADRLEHNTTAAQIEQVIRETGNPRFDPHGDPIPSADGEMPPRQGEPLIALSPDTLASIVHVEDEPEAIYAQLRAQRIRVGQRVTVLDKAADRIRVEVDGEEHVMAPIVAANVWVTRLPADTQAERFDRLSSLRVGQSRKVIGISPLCQGLQRRRLLDLGLVPGTEVTAVMDSPTRNPTGYRIRGAVIALRREQADLVHIQPMGTAEGQS